MDLQPQLRILGHVALAMFFAAFIGLERELANKPAGLRTHMLLHLVRRIEARIARR